MLAVYPVLEDEKINEQTKKDQAKSQWYEQSHITLSTYLSQKQFPTGKNRKMQIDKAIF